MIEASVIQDLKENAKKRNFVQTVELIVNLSKNYDLKKPENRFVDYVELPHGRGKKIRIAAVVGPELKKIAEQIFDEVLTRDDLKELANNKRKAKEFAKRNYFVVAQATIMGDLGRYLGRYLAPRDKMPNPKYGMIFPDNVDEKYLRNLYEKLQKLVRVSVKKHKTFGIPIGTEDMPVEHLVDNAKHVIEWLYNRIPGGKSSIKSIYIKLTMSDSKRII